MASTYQESVEQTITAGEQIHQIVNGTATTEVTVEDGSKVPSIRKALLDNFYFKDPIAWQVGQTENVFNQLRQFTDGSWWYAPSATASNPISMGSTPVGDSLWKVYDFDAVGKLAPQLREALRRSYAEAGYNLVNGSFEAGGTLVNATDVLLQERTGKAFSGPAGVVAAGTNPAGGGFVDRSSSRYYVNNISKLITSNLSVGSVVNLGGYHNVMDFSHHTRVIASADDGTGVQLANGLWANILHDGEVDFSWSGALPSDADVSAKVQKFIDTYACKAVIVVKNLYTMAAKVRMKQGAVIRGTNKVNGLNVGGIGPTATPPAQQNGFILKSINGWAFDSSIYKLVSGSWVRQDDFIGKAGDIYDGSNYRAVNNCHFKDLTFISADVLDPAENPALETFGAVNLNGSNGSTFKGCRVIGTILGVCVSGSWGHEVTGNLLQCKLTEYVSYWCSWTKAANNYCSSFNWTLDWNTRFAPYAAKLPAEMTQVRGFAAGQSPFGKTITNMISIDSSTVFEDNFTERGILGYGIEDQDTHWVPTFRGGRGEFHIVLYAARTNSALKFTFDFVANVSHLIELFQTANCVNEVCGSVNRPSTYGNVFNYLQGPSRPFLVLRGIDKDLLDAGSAAKVMRSEYIDGQNKDVVNATEYWSDNGPDCGITPLNAANGVPLRQFGNAGCVPIKVDVSGVQCYGLEVFAGTSLNVNGKTGTMRLFYHHPSNTFFVQGFDVSGEIKTATLSMV